MSDDNFIAKVHFLNPRLKGRATDKEHNIKFDRPIRKLESISLSANKKSRHDIYQ